METMQDTSMQHTSFSFRSGVTLERPTVGSDRRASPAGLLGGHLPSTPGSRSTRTPSPRERLTAAIRSRRRAPSADDTVADRWNATERLEGPREQLLRLHPNHLFRVH